MANITPYNFNWYVGGTRIPGDWSLKKVDLYLKDNLEIMDIKQPLSLEAEILHDKLLRSAGIEIQKEEKKVEREYNHPDGSAIPYFQQGSFVGLPYEHI